MHINIMPSNLNLKLGNQTVLNKRNPAKISIVTGQLDFGSYTLKAYNSPNSQNEHHDEKSSSHNLME
jgi:hypothetical protein